MEFRVCTTIYLADNEVDGDTVDCGLTETMVAYLFQGSFKKQVKFNQFVSRMKESSVTLTLQTVSPEDWQPSTSSTSIRYVLIYNEVSMSEAYMLAVMHF